MKKGILYQLTQGKVRVFIVMNALGLGIDILCIRVVVHVGRVGRLDDYVQESGRVGRDRKKSEAIIIKAVRVGSNGQVI